MSLNIHDRHLVDRYLNGELSGIELEEFNAKLSADADFKQSVELQRVIYSGIVYSREAEIKKKIQASIHYRKSSVPFGLKLIITFLIILVLGITFWSYLGNEFEKLKPYNNFISLFKKQPKQEVGEKKIRVESIKNEGSAKETTLAADSTVQDTVAIKSDSTGNN